MQAAAAMHTAYISACVIHPAHANFLINVWQMMYTSIRVFDGPLSVHLPWRGHREDDAANDVAGVARSDPLEQRLVVLILDLLAAHDEHLHASTLNIWMQAFMRVHKLLLGLSQSGEGSYPQGLIKQIG